VSDPYELLRRAREFFTSKVVDIPEAAQWLKEYDKLPGAELDVRHLRVLKHASLRCKHSEKIVERLLEERYLKKVSVMRGWPGHASSHIVIRRSEKGRLALLLRSDVDECCQLE